VANAARLEVDLTFRGRKYPIRPTFAIIAGIEAATGQSCISLARKCLGADKPSLSEMAAIILQMVPLPGLSLESVGDTLVDEGMSDLWLPVGDILSRAVKGNADHMRHAANEASQNDKPVDPPPSTLTSSDG
jgi:hypothetical protein